MRVTGWILVVMGVVGAALCVYGVVSTHRAKAQLTDAATEVAARASELLDVVDGKLEVLPAQLSELTKSDRPEPVLDKLRVVEDGLQDASDVLNSVVALMNATAALRPGAEGGSEQRFPELAALATRLAALSAEVRSQLEDTQTWTLRFAVFTEAVAGVREEVDSTRAEARELKTDALDTLNTIAIAAIVFLLWMALGQIALAWFGRRKAREA